MKKNAITIPIISAQELTYSSQINKGSSCIVYKGRWRGTEIGIKEFKPEYKTTKKEMEKFLKELVTLSQIRHPNLLLLMGVCLDRPNLCIITEYVDNFTLFYALHRNHERKLNFRDRLSISV
jgi:serine/threonine protein kinase